ncbi:MAG: cytochrome b/b6 domain-containing protein [Acidobacteriaceae bacterium]
MSTVAAPPRTQASRHAALVRVTHWLTVLAFLALLITGGEIVISHPRFYWGETGNVNMRPAFTLPIPSSRDTVPTGYKYVMPDQNGWSRYLHFEAAWLLVLCGLAYGIFGFWTGHFRRNLLPQRGQRSWPAYRQRMAQYLRRLPPQPGELRAYNVLQRTIYLLVIFVVVPLTIWTGLAMSLAIEGDFPWAVAVLGGRQSARTLHFFLSWALLLFLVVHVVMVARSGFRNRMRGMITGRVEPEDESGDDA